MTLRPDDEAYATALIAAGRYKTIEEVIATAFKVLRLAEEDREEFLESCRQGSAEIDAGGGIDGEAMQKELLRLIRITGEVERRVAEEEAADTAHTA